MSRWPGGGGWVWPVVAAVAVRPRLWPAAVAQARRLAPRCWWRRWPPLPAPDPAWLRFRARTAYGDPDHPPEPADVVAWLEWCSAIGGGHPGRSGRR